MEGFDMKCGEKLEGVNVQVVLRCRPLSEEDEISRTPTVVTCDELKGEVLAIRSIGNKQTERAFVFDKVFGPTSQQVDLFTQSISPLVSDVLEGFHCTIFAYGQTATGKTYTMEGGKMANNGELHSDAGVIQRSAQKCFEELEAKRAKYIMKVSFLEIYNEEITDLLSSKKWEFLDDKSTRRITLMEDGKGGVFVRGMEEDIVYSADEIYKILDNATTRRHSTANLLNKHSSRSHSIFSITIHIKDISREGQEIIKIGKLNLVDLAGSVNILRSGAREGRAREAGEINKSLLTLGRVINALVDESSHVPYRDSKLTRLLRNSLGGKTKACIIATISPSIHCLEETLCTLDYAHRARNIKSKPEINQKIMESTMMKDLNYEIDRLKKELNATNEKNSIHISRDCFLQEDEKKAIAEKMERIELKLKFKDKQLIVLQELYDSQQYLTADLIEELDHNQIKLEGSEKMVLDQEEKYQKAKCVIRENERLIMKLQHSERELVEHAQSLRSELEFNDADISSLLCKIEHKCNIEERNQIILQRFQSHLTQQLHILLKIVSTSVMEQENHLQEIEDEMHSFVCGKAMVTREYKGWVEKLKDLYCSGITTLDGLAGELDQNSQLTFGKFYSQVLTHSTYVDDCLRGITFEADNLLKELQTDFSNQIFKLNVFGQLQHEGHQRTAEATRSISNTFINFLHMLDVHASRLSKILEETQIVEDQQLSNLERKFEECAANEDKQLLEKVVEMLTSSNALQRKQVQKAIDALRQNAHERTSNLQKEVSKAQNFTSLIKEQWRFYIEETERHYLGNVAAVESRRCSLEEGLNDCFEKTEMGSLLWENSWDFRVSLGKETITLMESIVRNGIEANQKIRADISSGATTALENLDAGVKALQSSIDCSLESDHDAWEKINSIIVPSRREQSDLKSRHCDRILEIKECVDKCVKHEYMVSV
ncbi:125 kDa kinesin-related protein [Platanthera guangdongensis]|uniref:125 kDa kinesin-related protein n=1 Tax=Platanthera guangdongensis TaxID=2320717 RepID=A0ABR2LR16_9ASPA